jgi:hypothetical protein
MLHEYHGIYSVQYYPRFHVTAVGLGTYYPWIWGQYYNCIMNCKGCGRKWLWPHHLPAGTSQIKTRNINI